MNKTNTLIDNDNTKTKFCKTHFTFLERTFVETFLKGNSKMPLKEAIKELSKMLKKHPKTIKRGMCVDADGKKHKIRNNCTAEM